jgi:hypothetical protein
MNASGINTFASVDLAVALYRGATLWLSDPAVIDWLNSSKRTVPSVGFDGLTFCRAKSSPLTQQFTRHIHFLLLQPLRNANAISQQSSHALPLCNPTELNNAPHEKPVRRATAVIKFRIIPTKSERSPAASFSWNNRGV